MKLSQVCREVQEDVICRRWHAKRHSAVIWRKKEEKEDREKRVGAKKKWFVMEKDVVMKRGGWLCGVGEWISGRKEDATSVSLKPLFLYELLILRAPLRSR